MDWQPIAPLDPTGDDKRIVKLADIDMFVECHRLVQLLVPYYMARHRPTGIESSPYSFMACKPMWAAADCVERVIHQTMCAPPTAFPEAAPAVPSDRREG